MIRALFKTAAILWILLVGLQLAQGAVPGPQEAFWLILPALAVFLFLTFLPKRRAKRPQPVVVAAPAAPAATPAAVPPQARRRGRRSLLIWGGALLFGAGLLLPWVHVQEQTESGGWETQVRWTGLDLKEPPFDTRLPGIALGLGAVNLVLGFAIRRGSARSLAFLVVLAGLACMGVNAYVLDAAEPGRIFRGEAWEGTTTNELEAGFFVTLAGGALLVLGGLLAFALARRERPH